MSDLSTSAAPTLAQRRLLAMPGLERSLMGRHPVSPQDELRSIIAELDRGVDGGEATDATEATWDPYGEGGPVAALES